MTNSASFFAFATMSSRKLEVEAALTASAVKQAATSINPINIKLSRADCIKAPP
jgi:hypothetical protein